MADHFEVRSWDNFVFLAKYLLDMTVNPKSIPKSAVRYSLYGSMIERINYRKKKRRMGHFVYLHYAPYDLSDLGTIPGSDNWKFRPMSRVDHVAP